MITDPAIIRIGQVVPLGHQGEREAARLRFSEIRKEIGGVHGAASAASHDRRCTRRRAPGTALGPATLAATGLINDARVEQAEVTPSPTRLHPSLHLNLSECYGKLGDLNRAREHLQHALDTIGALGDDLYGK